MHSPFLAVFIREPINLSCVKVQYAERPFLAFGQTLTHTQSMILFPEGNNRRLFPSAPTASRIAVKRAALVGGVGGKAPRFYGILDLCRFILLIVYYQNNNYLNKNKRTPLVGSL